MLKQPLRPRIFLLVLIAAFCLSGFAHAQTGKLKQRSDIDPKYKWNLADMYPSDDAWEKDFTYLKNNLSRMESFKGQLASSPEVLYKALKLRDSLGLMSDNLVVYAGLKLDEDNRQSKYQELADRISTLNATLNNASAYIEPEILGMDQAKLDSYVASPVLKEYAFYLQTQIHARDHILSDKEEALLASGAPVFGAPSRIFNMINDADINYGTI